MCFRGLLAHFFLSLDNIPLSGYSSLFIHSPSEGHLSDFQVLAIIHVHIQVFV